MKELLSTPEINELTASIQEGRSIAFIGSGLSMGEYVGWGELIENLCAACGISLDDNSGDLLDLAQQAKDSSPDDYHKALSDEFGKEGVHMPPSYIYLLESPFNAYISINYDPLLAEASRFKGLTLYDFKLGLDSSRVKDKSIFYIHGYVKSGGHIGNGELILTKDDFDTNYDHLGAIIPSFLTQVLSFKPVVFLGCSLQEPALKKILGMCNEIRSRIEERSESVGPIHYILLPTLYTRTQRGEEPRRDTDKEAEEDAQYEEVGIRVVRFTRRTPKDFTPVEKLLRIWSDAPELKPVSAYDEGPRYD